MTEDQFLKGADIVSAIRGVKYLIEDVSRTNSTIRDTLNVHHIIDSAVELDIKNIISEHNKLIKEEILECLRQHVIRLEHDLEMV